MEQSLLQKITSLNQTTLEVMVEKDKNTIIKKFTETGIEILHADFGFAWWKFSEDGQYELAYKSPGTPYEPTLPRKKAGNYIARKTRKPFFDSDVKKEDYKFDIQRYLKSYIIIPIFYGEMIYGSITLCFKKEHSFGEDELALAIALGNTAAQTISMLRMRASKEILDEQKKLLSEEKMKLEFIADATHEIRTPLAIIRGNVDLALMKGLGNPKSVVATFKDINHQIEHLSELLSDLTLITSGKTESYRMIKNQKINMPGLLKHVVKNCEKIAFKQQISIKIKKIPEASVSGDKIYIEKLFRNIIKNAVTYGKEKGSIEISGSTNGRSIEIYIKDNGVGISKKDLPNIFRRFFKAEQSKTAKKGGVGLGLAIAKRVAEEHGGDIKATSTLGEGSTFSVSLPLIK